MRHTKDVEDRLYPMLRAENAEVLIHPSDRKYGALLIGGQGCGKTSALLSFYLNDIEDENAAPIVIDPKSELSRVCLRLTPPDCGKRVWFLDLGRPAFGMSPLRLIGDRPLAIEAAQIADNVVAALLDINENQIYQSSRRYLNHAVIGAIAIATKQGRRARLEDVYTLLRPAKDEFRSAVAEACADQPDLDQTAEFFRSELPDDLRMATSRVAERLDAPRNKISGLTGVPPLRRFFNHPTDVPLREIIQARDILIVDANMGAIGTENSKACMLFILRMLHAQLQRQVHLPEAERPRVPLLVDEAHYVASGENVVDQIATHRAAGLEAAFGLQYFAQLGSASEHQQKILKGVLNLLQSRFLFRMGDAQDAEQATRIAMAVYATMIRDDPDSRARLRVTPEQALNFPNYYCLASWIANGTRAPSFMGQTYPLPDVGDEWAEQHLAAQDERVGPYPEQLESTLATDTVPANDEWGRVKRQRRATTRRQSTHARHRCLRRTRTRSRPLHSRLSTRCRSTTSRRSEDAADLADSPVRRLVGRPRSQERSRRRRSTITSLRRRTRCASSRSSTGSTRSGRPTSSKAQAGLPRLYDEDYAILALLDRVGLAPPSLIGRAALPGRATRSVNDRLIKLYRHGLIARHNTGLRERTRTDGKAPVLYSLTRRGLAGRPGAQARAGDLPQARVAADRAAARRPARARPARARLGDRVPPGCRRARHRPLAHPPLRHRPLPRPPSRLRATPPPDHAQRDQGPRRPGDHRPRAEDVHRDQARPLARAPLRTAQAHLRPARRDRPHRAPLLQPREVPRLRRVPLRLGLAHPRYRAQGTRPAVVFVSPNQHAALACAREADELMTGRIGVMGAPAEHWYYAGRDHLFFAVEEDIHHGELSALALPAQPPGLRERLNGARDLSLEPVSLVRRPSPTTASSIQAP